MENNAQSKEQHKCNSKPGRGTDAAKQPGAPVTYTLDGRSFIVRPVFKEKSAHTLSAALLRLMQSDLETN